MKLPKGCEDLLPLLTEAARIRKDFFMRHNKRDQHTWRLAYDELLQSRNPVYLQKTGPNAGIVVKGLPKKIKNEVLQILIDIARSGFDENADKFPAAAGVSVGIEHTNEVTRRVYRDSKYALLAVLYSNQTMQNPTWVYRTTLIAEIGAFTDLPVEYDYRSRTHGAIKGMDDLVNKALVLKRKDFNNSVTYSLTQTGLRCCYHLFEVKFHPNNGPYTRVKPRPGCTVRPDGSIAGDYSSGLMGGGGLMYGFGHDLSADEGEVYGLDPKYDSYSNISQRSHDGMIPDSNSTLFVDPAALRLQRVQYFEGNGSASKHSSRQSSAQKNTDVIDLFGEPERKRRKVEANDDEDAELRLAMELSKESLQETTQQLKMRSRGTSSNGCASSTIIAARTPMDIIEHKDAAEAPGSSNAKMIRHSVTPTTVKEAIDLTGDDSRKRPHEEENFIDLTDSQNLEEEFISIQQHRELHPANTNRPRDLLKKESAYAGEVVQSSMVSGNVGIVLLVDRRERHANSSYRHFLYDVQLKCRQHNSMVTVEQDTLALGDFAVVYSDAKEGKSWLSDIVIERKALNDLISRSAGRLSGGVRTITAPHIAQEKKLRHSGLLHTFLLIEGSLSCTDRLGGPQVRHDAELINPDALNSKEDVIFLIAGVIARNYAVDRRVRTVQTANVGQTSIFVNAIALTEYWLHKSMPLNKELLLPAKADFDKHANKWGGCQKGREFLLRNALQEAGVDSEMLERVVRRFGDLNSLQSVYKLCAIQQCRPSTTTADACIEQMQRIDTRCMLLLSDLEVGGVQSQRTVLTSRTASIAKNTLADSIRVWAMLRMDVLMSCSPCCEILQELQNSSRAELLLFDADDWIKKLLSAEQQPPISEQPFRQTKLTLCTKMQQKMGTSSNAFPSFIQLQCNVVDIISDDNVRSYPHACIECEETVYTTEILKIMTTAAENKVHCTRRSSPIHVMIVPGDHIVEALLIARSLTSTSGEADNRESSLNDVETVEQAMHIIERRFPDTCRSQRTNANPNDIQKQVVVIIENFSHGAHGALKKFQRSMSLLGATIQQLESSGGSARSTKKKAESICELNIESLSPRCGPWLDANAEWLSGLITAVCSRMFGWQPIFTPNGPASEGFFMALLHEVQTQSLLVF